MKANQQVSSQQSGSEVQVAKFEQCAKSAQVRPLTKPELRKVRSRIRSYLSGDSVAEAVGVSKSCLRKAMLGGRIQVAKIKAMVGE